MSGRNPYRGPAVWGWWTWWPYYLRCAIWHRWNVVKCPTLPPTYQAPSELVLHASMACLVRYVEQQAGGCDWSWDEGHAHAKAEMDAIYAWWTKERNTERAAEVAALERWYLQRADHRPTPQAEADFAAACAVEAANDERETEMLIRLAKIRGYLWS